MVSIDDLPEIHDELFEYDSNLSDDENFLRKFALKERALNLISNKEYAMAKSFLISLTMNSYFENDYFPYRQLCIVCDKLKDFDTQLNAINSLIRNEVYCTNYQFIWFSHKYLKLQKRCKLSDDEVESNLLFFKEHYSLKEDLRDTPVILADRTFKRRNSLIEIDPVNRYERRQEQYFLEETARELRRQGNYEEAINLYQSIIDSGKYKTYRYYMDLCDCYKHLKDYEKELEIIHLYFDQAPSKTGYSNKWFEKRLKKVEGILNRRKYKPGYTMDVSVSNNNSSKNALSNNELLIKFAEMYEKGLLTREEFDKKKQELL